MGDGGFGWMQAARATHRRRRMWRQHRPEVCAGARRARRFDMRKERRHRRAQTVTLALSYQLDDCCKEGDIEAMVVADRDGLPLAAAGDSYACDEVAARMVLVGPKIAAFDGTLLGAGKRWDV